MSKILCVITSMGSGGAERQLSGLAKMLKDYGHDIKVIWYAKGDFYKPFLEENDIANQYINSPKHYQKVLNIAKAIKAYQPDTVISFLTGPNVITPLLKLCGLKYHLIVSDRNTLQTLNWKYKLCFFLFRWADVIVPNSFTEGEIIKTHFPNLAKKVNVITNFTDTDHFCPSERKENTGSVKILVVARVIEQKNVERFLHAVALLKQKGVDVKIEWYGDSYEQSYRDARIQEVESLGISDMITIYPSTREILNKYREADVFCLPSLHEGFPNVVCEAMSCGLPILCSKVSDNPFIVQDGINGYTFDPYSVEDIANSIEKYVMEMHPRRGEIAKMNRGRIKEICSRDAFLNKYLKIIK